MRHPSLAALALGLAAAPTAVLAQAPPQRPQPAPAAAKPKEVEGVVVRAGQPDVQSGIDRRSYTLGKDLQATTGSIADALRNVPSVEVDVSGNLTLRGDANVTIMVDGKPAPQFDGAARADSLQQLPADQVERVEVITNPSAALNPEGSGGVINLVTKKSRGAGQTGSVYATLGSQATKRAGATVGYNTKKLAVTASLSGNYQRNKSLGTDHRTSISPAGVVLSEGDYDFGGRNLNRTPSGRLNVSYELSPKDQLTFAFSANKFLLYGRPHNRFFIEDGAGSLVRVNVRDGQRRFQSMDTSLTAGWRHRFGEGHDLSLDLIRNNNRPTDYTRWFTSFALPVTTTPSELYVDRSDNLHSEARLAYTRPMPDKATLKLGYEFKQDHNVFDHLDAFGPRFGAEVPDTRLSNGFDYEQTIHTGYATYERAFGEVSVQTGLRLENVTWDLFSPMLNRTFSQDYFKAYPTLHLGYDLGDGQKVRASYSRRVQRPPGFLLNPVRLQQDPGFAQQGNPNLKPQDTASYELGFEQRGKGDFYSATAYLRRTSGDFNPVFRDAGGGLYLLTYENIGTSQTMGLELVANGKLTPTLTYNASANLYRNEIDARGIAGVGIKRSLTGAGGRMNLNWQVRPDDLVQLNAFVQGRRLAAQGNFTPIAAVNLGWRHKFDDKLTATVTVQDLFASNKFHRNLTTPTIIERAVGDPVTRGVFLRLDYRFGQTAKGRPQREPGFEYEGGGGPTPGQ